jgi:hypothetical protein
MTTLKLKPMLTMFRGKLSGSKLVLAVAVVLCCAISQVNALQVPQRPEPIIVYGSNNETTKAELDLLAEKAGKDKLIILIARLGRREFSRRLSQQRLRTVRDYLRFTRAMSENRLITAEGERVSDFGRVEAYLDGKLVMVFRLSPNKNFASEP